jgi:hypothetical protein
MPIELAIDPQCRLGIGRFQASGSFEAPLFRARRLAQMLRRPGLAR